MRSIPGTYTGTTDAFYGTNGIALAANYVLTNAIASQSLGRPLSGGLSQVTVNLLTPSQMYGERLNQVDLRAGKVLKFGRVRTQLALDLYNLLNLNTTTSYLENYGTNGATYLQPLSVLRPRFLRLNATVDFSYPKARLVETQPPSLDGTTLPNGCICLVVAFDTCHSGNACP